MYWTLTRIVLAILLICKCYLVRIGTNYSYTYSTPYSHRDFGSSQRDTNYSYLGNDPFFVAMVFLKETTAAFQTALRHIYNRHRLPEPMTVMMKLRAGFAERSKRGIP